MAEFREFGKIQTLFERKPDFSVDTGVLRSPVIDSIAYWVVTEKIDGMNCRICLTEDDEVLIGGRTGKAQIPTDLFNMLYKTFTPEKMMALRKGEDKDVITLYGEGYGAGIQKGGGNYRKDKGFILFDAQVNDRYWLQDSAVTDIADALDIPRVPILGHGGPHGLCNILADSTQPYRTGVSSCWTLPNIIALCETGFDSLVAETPHPAEGIVARTVQPLFDARGKRVIIKLKTSDFKVGKR